MFNSLFHFNKDGHPLSSFRITQLHTGAVFELFTVDHVLLGTIKRYYPGWEQLTGLIMHQDLMNAIGMFIDENKIGT